MVQKYKAPDGSIHKSEIDYLKGVIDDLRQTVEGQKVLISELASDLSDKMDINIGTMYMEGNNDKKEG